jgi:hypothetical protein
MLVFAETPCIKVTLKFCCLLTLQLSTLTGVNVVKLDDVYALFAILLNTIVLTETR